MGANTKLENVLHFSLIIIFFRHHLQGKHHTVPIECWKFVIRKYFSFGRKKCNTRFLFLLFLGSSHTLPPNFFPVICVIGLVSWAISELSVRCKAANFYLSTEITSLGGGGGEGIFCRAKCVCRVRRSPFAAEMLRAYCV